MNLCTSLKTNMTLVILVYWLTIYGTSASQNNHIAISSESANSVQNCALCPRVVFPFKSIQKSLPPSPTPKEYIVENIQPLYIHQRDGEKVNSISNFIHIPKRRDDLHDSSDPSENDDKLRFGLIDWTLGISVSTNYKPVLASPNPWKHGWGWNSENDDESDEEEDEEPEPQLISPKIPTEPGSLPVAVTSTQPQQSIQSQSQTQPLVKFANSTVTTAQTSAIQLNNSSPIVEDVSDEEEEEEDDNYRSNESRFRSAELDFDEEFGDDDGDNEDELKRQQILEDEDEEEDEESEEDPKNKNDRDDYEPENDGEKLNQQSGQDAQIDDQDFLQNGDDFQGDSTNPGNNERFLLLKKKKILAGVIIGKKIKKALLAKKVKKKLLLKAKLKKKLKKKAIKKLLLKKKKKLIKKKAIKAAKLKKKLKLKKIKKKLIKKKIIKAKLKKKAIKKAILKKKVVKAKLKKKAIKKVIKKAAIKKILKKKAIKKALAKKVIKKAAIKKALKKKAIKKAVLKKKIKKHLIKKKVVKLAKLKKKKKLKKHFLKKKFIQKGLKKKLKKKKIIKDLIVKKKNKKKKIIGSTLGISLPQIPTISLPLPSIQNNLAFIKGKRPPSILTKKKKANDKDKKIKKKDKDKKKKKGEDESESESESKSDESDEQYWELSDPGSSNSRPGQSLGNEDQEPSKQRPDQDEHPTNSDSQYFDLTKTPDQSDPDLAGIVQNVQNVVTAVGTGVAALTNVAPVTTSSPTLSGIKRFPPRPVNLGVKANLLNRFNKINKNVQQIASAFDAVSRSDLDLLNLGDLAPEDLEEEETNPIMIRSRSTGRNFWGLNSKPV